MPYNHCRESLRNMAVAKPEGRIVLISFIGGSSYFQVSEQGPSFWRELISENHNAQDLSSWLKQNIILCYKQADKQSLDLVQVKANDIRAFLPSKAFCMGIWVDQIMPTCH